MSQKAAPEQRSIPDRRDLELNTEWIAAERRAIPERRFPEVQIFDIEEHIEIPPTKPNSSRQSG